MDDYQKVKRQVERLKAEKERAEGALQQLIQQLKEESGCNNLKEAEALLLQLEQTEREMFRKYSRMMEKFQEKWSEVLDT